MVGLGLHILPGSVDRATAQLSQSLGINTGEVLGLVPSAVLAASQAARVLPSIISEPRRAYWDAGGTVAAAARNCWSDVVAGCFQG